MIVVKRRAAIGRDAVGAGQNIDPLAVDKGGVRPDALADQNASPRSGHQMRMQPHRSPLVSDHDKLTIRDAKIRRIQRIDHDLRPAFPLG